MLQHGLGISGKMKAADARACNTNTRLTTHLRYQERSLMANSAISPSLSHESPDQTAMSEARLRRFRLWLKYDRRCGYCGTQVELGMMQLDHIIPRHIAKGARNNLMPSCGHCNNSKHRQSLEEFRINRQRKAAGVPYFSPDQLTWLESQGFQFPDGEPYVFWFETREGRG